MLHFRARKAFLNPEKQRLWEVWQLTIERGSCRRSHILGDKPGYNSSQREEKIFGDMKGTGREISGGLVYDDKSVSMMSDQRDLGL